MKLVVSGSRTINDKQQVWSQLDKYRDGKDIEQLICGGAIGVDRQAIDWAVERKVKYKVYYPQYGKFFAQVAPLKRNEDMANVGDELIAIWNGRSTGTAHMIECMKKRNKPVTVIVGEQETKFNHG